MRAATRGALGGLLLAGAVQTGLPATAAERGGALLPGSAAKEPVSIDAGRLDYFDKEQKLVYSGDVVARQGASTLKGSMLTIFMSRAAKAVAATDAGGEAAAVPTPGLGGDAGGSIDRMEVKGPVTVISRDEVGTGDNGSYDKGANTITLTGNVTLTQATNIIKGDRLVYDMTSGQARVSSGQTQGRVRSVFTPGSAAPSVATKKKTAPVGGAPGKAQP